VPRVDEAEAPGARVEDARPHGHELILSRDARDQPVHLSQRHASLSRLIEDARLQKEASIDAEQYEAALKLDSRIKDLKKKQSDIDTRLTNTNRKSRASLEMRDLARAVSHTTGIPEQKLMADASTRITSLNRHLGKHIVGQKTALEAIARVLVRSYAGLNSPTRPLGSFLLLGPSGVGKTYTAKILAKHLFDRDDALIRVDMSEFSERHHIAGLIGAPAGYVGYGEGGKFTERVRKNPHSVILFDEMEKAHPDVLNILLQILEDGTLTDGEGRVVTFRESIILLTSNIGSAHIRSLGDVRLGFGDKTAPHTIETEQERALRRDIESSMRPELLDRLDHVLIYKPLKKSHIRSIVRTLLKDVVERSKEKKCSLSWDSKTETFLVERACSERTGARNVRRAIQDQIENTIAPYLLKKQTPKNIHLEIRNNDIFVIAK